MMTRGGLRDVTARLVRRMKRDILTTRLRAKHILDMSSVPWRNDIWQMNNKSVKFNNEFHAFFYGQDAAYWAQERQYMFYCGSASVEILLTPWI